MSEMQNLQILHLQSGGFNNIHWLLKMLYLFLAALGLHCCARALL